MSFCCDEERHLTDEEGRIKMIELETLLQLSKYGTKEMKEDVIDGAEHRWIHKKVHKTLCVYDNAVDRHAVFHGTGTFDYVTDFGYHNETSMHVEANTDIEDVRPRPFSSVHIPFVQTDWTGFNRIRVMVYPKSTGFQNFYFHFSLYHKNGEILTHAPSLTPNQWNPVMFEFPHLPVDEIVKLTMGPLMMGCPPEALPMIDVYFGNVYIEEVELDHTLGWDIQNTIAYSHVGYRTTFDKIAITNNQVPNEFVIKNDSGHVVYKGISKKVSTLQGSYSILDFSKLTDSGVYTLEVGKLTTKPFVISDNPYLSSIWKSLHFLKMLRCGDDVDGVHSPCHLTHYTVHPDGRMVSDCGGWHDAGDVSQFEICTAEMLHALVDLAIKVKDTDSLLYERILEEARWGANWMLKTHFGDGFRALAVHYSIWRKNIIKNYQELDPSNTHFNKNVAENGPFENMLAAASLAKTAYVFQDHDEIFANWCKRTAIADFKFGLQGYRDGLFTVRWGKGPVAQVAGSIVLAACELYLLTHDQEYQGVAKEFAKEVMKCQQVEYPNWEKPIRGFFYEDETHTSLLTYEHRGHEQSPITALTKCLETFPNDTDACQWKRTLELYLEYIDQTMYSTAPYGLLPGHIYHYDYLNMTRFTIPRGYGTEIEIAENFKRQIQDGIALGNEFYLRRMPIAIQRRGYHATLLSKAKGVSAIAKVLNNSKYMQIALNQLEWIFGKNPFSSSTMYGEGYNYHPLYVAFSRQIVGSLPVGIETLGEKDAPYWPVHNNAVFKEVWGHTTGKYLWILADIL